LIVSLLNDGRGANFNSSQFEENGLHRQLVKGVFAEVIKAPFALVAGFTFKKCKIVKEVFSWRAISL
jgi:hypothetical protein